MEAKLLQDKPVLVTALLPVRAIANAVPGAQKGEGEYVAPGTPILQLYRGYYQLSFSLYMCF